MSVGGSRLLLVVNLCLPYVLYKFCQSLILLPVLLNTQVIILIGLQTLFELFLQNHNLLLGKVMHMYQLLNTLLVLRVLCLEVRNLLSSLGESLGKHWEFTQNVFECILSIPFILSQQFFHKTSQKCYLFLLSKNKLILCTDMFCLL